VCIYLGGCIIEIRRLLQFLVGDQSIVVEMSVFIRDHSGGQFSWVLKNGSIVKPYTGNMCVHEIHRNFIKSQRARKASYLYSETATYIRSRKDNKEPIWKTREKQVRTKLHNQSTDWAVT